MIHENYVNFGSIQIHKEALADIAFSAISEIEGVSLLPKSAKSKLFEFFGKREYEGIKIKIDKDNQISIHIKLLARYGINIPTIGRQVQEAVRIAVEKTADVNLKDINVNVCGIERGSR